MRALAPCKVNPTLEVLGRRADGYHELETTLLALDLCDRLELVAREEPGVGLLVRGEFREGVPADETNLVWRAVEAVLEQLGATDRGVSVTLEKRIPNRAGLGGGSADAAAAALACARLVGGEALDCSFLTPLVATLGSDCAFFLEAAATGFAICQGRGDRVLPLEVIGSDWHVVLVAPRIGCSTREVYEALEFPLSGGRASSSVPKNLLGMSEKAVRALLFNRLEFAALEAVPALGAWRSLLDETGGEHFRLSGSGSSFFGMFKDRARAEESWGSIRQAAREADLELGGAWVLSPASHGATLSP